MEMLGAHDIGPRRLPPELMGERSNSHSDNFSLSLEPIAHIDSYLARCAQVGQLIGSAQRKLPPDTNYRLLPLERLSVFGHHFDQLPRRRSIAHGVIADGDFIAGLQSGWLPTIAFQPDNRGQFKAQRLL